jgi:hypothetical protein
MSSLEKDSEARSFALLSTTLPLKGAASFDSQESICNYRFTHVDPR